MNRTEHVKGLNGLTELVGLKGACPGNLDVGTLSPASPSTWSKSASVFDEVQHKGERPSRLAAWRLAVLLAAGLLGASAPAEPSSGLTLQFSTRDQPVIVSVSGLVRDKATGQPIANALVRAHIVVWGDQGPELFEKCPTQQTVTDPGGQYRFTFTTPLTTHGPMAGKDGLCVYASAPGYETLPSYASTDVSPNNRVFTNLDFTLGPGKKLVGVVVDATGAPVSGAVVRVQNGFNGDWNFFGSLGRTTTGLDGSFRLWMGPIGNDYLGNKPWLSIVKPDIGTLFVWDLQAKENLGTLKLNPGGELTGKVLDTRGAPFPNCELSVRRWPCGLVAETLSDADGNYRLNGIPGEPSISDFYKNKNGSYKPAWGQVEVYARSSPGMNLKDAPHLVVTPKDGQILACSNLVIGAEAGVSGALLPSKTALSLGGLLVRLDGKWDDMVEADLNGRFNFPFVAPGKHTLTAYLPFNLRYDRGIGKTQIEVQAGQSLKNVQIQLADLAELRVQYLDANGNPLPGVTAAATWSRNGDGAWTEGTLSDADGWAVLYLYPDSIQYVRAFDKERKLTAETVKEVNPEPGQVFEPVQVVLVPTANLTGRLIGQNGQPIASETVLATLHLADGTDYRRRLKTDGQGSFHLDRVTPGVLRLAFEIGDVLYQDPLGKPFELRPGQTENLGDLTLKDGLDRAKASREKEAQAVAQPRELLAAAQTFFDGIRKADYDYFLQPGADWHKFPIVGSYQTYKWFDSLVTWMSRTFKTNPIVNVELGRPFANPQQINGKSGLPTVPYKLTLKDGAILQGKLPFEYEFDGATGHWFGLHGIDWHLQ